MKAAIRVPRRCRSLNADLLAAEAGQFVVPRAGQGYPSKTGYETVQVQYARDLDGFPPVQQTPCIFAVGNNRVAAQYALLKSRDRQCIPITEVELAPRPAVEVLLWSPDGSRLASVRYTDGGLRIWDVKTGLPQAAFQFGENAWWVTQHDALPIAWSRCAIRSA